VLFLTARRLWVQMYRDGRGREMESNELTTAQAERIRDALLPHVRYLYKLKTRMEKTGFPPGDRLFRLTCSAYDSAQQLAMALHYLSCESGVGGEPKALP
jgi:hypothetical protein